MHIYCHESETVQSAAVAIQWKSWSNPPTLSITKETIETVSVSCIAGLSCKRSQGHQASSLGECHVPFILALGLRGMQYQLLWSKRGLLMMQTFPPPFRICPGAPSPVLSLPGAAPVLD